MNKPDLLDISSQLKDSPYRSIGEAFEISVNEWLPVHFSAKIEPDVGVYSSFIRGDVISSWGTQAYGGYRLDSFQKDDRVRRLTVQGYNSLLHAANFLSFNKEQKDSLIKKMLNLDEFVIDLKPMPHKYYSFHSSSRIFAVLRSDGEIFSYSEHFEATPMFKNLSNLELLKSDLVKKNPVNKSAHLIEVLTILEQKISIPKEKIMLTELLQSLPSSSPSAPNIHKV